MDVVENKIKEIVKKCRDFNVVKIIDGDGTYGNPYQIIIFDYMIDEFEHTVVTNDIVKEVMNVTELTRWITKEINAAGFENFRLYMIPKW